MRYTQPALLEHLASTFVLGTLQGGARRRFERLQRERHDVGVLVAQWQMRLGQLAQSVPTQAPSPAVWAAISARTRPATASHAPLASWWRGWLRPAGWGLGGLATGLVAANVLFVLAPTLLMSSEQFAMRAGERLPPSYVGVLSDAQGDGKLLVSSLRHGQTVALKVIGPLTPPETGQLVLWALPVEGPAFVLGAAPSSGTALLQLPASSERLLSRVNKLLVTVELSATPSVPSESVVLSGNCAKLW